MSISKFLSLYHKQMLMQYNNHIVYIPAEPPYNQNYQEDT